MKFIGEARAIRTVYANEFTESIVLEFIDKRKALVTLKKESEDYNLVKSGEWLMIELLLFLKTTLKDNGDVYYANKVELERARELDDNEMKSLESEIEFYKNERLEKINHKKKITRYENERLINKTNQIENARLINKINEIEKGEIVNESI